MFARCSDKKVASPTRDVVKRQKQTKDRVGGAVEVCQKVLEAVLKKPSMLVNPEFQFLREFIHVVNGKPDVFPPLIPTDAARLISSMDDPELTKGVAEPLYARETIPKKITMVVTTILEGAALGSTGGSFRR